ncbi:hypothetical protein MRB53_037396 [Persea americana]|nr:hypothetical protein MRB53_037396 [Persea americana]
MCVSTEIPVSRNGPGFGRDIAPCVRKFERHCSLVQVQVLVPTTLFYSHSRILPEQIIKQQLRPTDATTNYQSSALSQWHFKVVETTRQRLRSLASMAELCCPVIEFAPITSPLQSRMAQNLILHPSRLAQLRTLPRLALPCKSTCSDSAFERQLQRSQDPEKAFTSPLRVQGLGSMTLAIWASHDTLFQAVLQRPSDELLMQTHVTEAKSPAIFEPIRGLAPLRSYELNIGFCIIYKAFSVTRPCRSRRWRGNSRLIALSNVSVLRSYSTPRSVSPLNTVTMCPCKVVELVLRRVVRLW